ncbi:hypothetical protein EYF80_043233 [Liparis tanakae]|uniref:Uncharacterized protein n=1 Tax=Liparis tanakae TaxID=230148 RepID=A0A4Z2FZ83_9TELE|nr:hypothetical protein EYF80_043233 [Liparis tanakae]
MSKGLQCPLNTTWGQHVAYMMEMMDNQITADAQVELRLILIDLVRCGLLGMPTGGRAFLIGLKPRGDEPGE